MSIISRAHEEKLSSLKSEYKNAVQKLHFGENVTVVQSITLAKKVKRLGSQIMKLQLEEARF